MNSVFKYCAPKRHYFEMLNNYQVNCSHPKYLNDEYENAAYLIEPYKSFCDAVRWGEKQKKQFDSHAIASFTNAEQADSEYFWNNYADKRSGFAIEFDKHILKEVIANEYVFPCYLQDVEYIDGLYNLDNFQNRFEVNGEQYTVDTCIRSFMNGDSKPMERLFQHLRLVKNIRRWNGENESRIVIGNIRDSHHLHWNDYGCFLDLPKGTIKSIALGENISDDDLNEINSIAESIGVPVIRK